MAGFLRQLAAVIPASAVRTRFDLAFEEAMRQPGAELYDSLVQAWEEAIKVYAEKELAIYQFHEIFRVRDGICKVFATISDLKTAASSAGMVLASFTYPAFAQVRDCEASWRYLLNVLEGVRSGSPKFKTKFSELNPRCVAMLKNTGAEPLNQVEAAQLQDFLIRWAAINDIRWRF